MANLVQGLTVGGQSLTDRIVAAKYTLAGQGLAKSVGKATTEEAIAPKKKHLDSKYIMERTRHNNWVVVYKALCCVHHLMNYGNERFIQYLAAPSANVSLDHCYDRIQHLTPESTEMYKYIVLYANYLRDKCKSYQLMAFDFCKVKRGKEDGYLRVMDAEKILAALPVLQLQIDSLLEFEMTSSDINDPIMISAYSMLFKDLVRLYACYNDGIINILEKYFTMSRSHCKKSVAVYKKFLERMEKTKRFFDTVSACKQLGVDKSEIPDVVQAPDSLLESLVAHYETLEEAKKEKKKHKTAAGPQLDISAFTQADKSQANDEVKENGATAPKTVADAAANLQRAIPVAMESTESKAEEPVEEKKEEPEVKAKEADAQIIDIFGGDEAPSNAKASGVPSNDLLNFGIDDGGFDSLADAVPMTSDANFDPFAPAGDTTDAKEASAKDTSADLFGTDTDFSAAFSSPTQASAKEKPAEPKVITETIPVSEPKSEPSSTAEDPIKVTQIESPRKQPEIAVEAHMKDEPISQKTESPVVNGPTELTECDAAAVTLTPAPSASTTAAVSSGSPGVERKSPSSPRKEIHVEPTPDISAPKPETTPVKSVDDLLGGEGEKAAEEPNLLDMPTEAAPATKQVTNVDLLSSDDLDTEILGQTAGSPIMIPGVDASLADLAAPLQTSTTSAANMPTFYQPTMMTATSNPASSTGNSAAAINAIMSSYSSSTVPLPQQSPSYMYSPKPVPRGAGMVGANRPPQAQASPAKKSQPATQNDPFADLVKLK